VLSDYFKSIWIDKNEETEDGKDGPISGLANQMTFSQNQKKSSTTSCACWIAVSKNSRTVDKRTANEQGRPNARESSATGNYEA
jgi:hypothetical protein